MDRSQMIISLDNCSDVCIFVYPTINFIGYSHLD